MPSHTPAEILKRAREARGFRSHKSGHKKMPKVSVKAGRKRRNK